MISRNDSRKELRIREYVVIERNSKKVIVSMLEKSKFSFLCEETYDSEIINQAITKGVQSLVFSLRTRNIFPIAPYATKIAESVIALYSEPGDGAVELFFDDRDLVTEPMNPNTVTG
jgi:hypothetical protein